MDITRAPWRLISPVFCEEKTDQEVLGKCLYSVIILFQLCAHESLLYPFFLKNESTSNRVHLIKEQLLSERSNGYGNKREKAAGSPVD
jgi:hypothetical protein